MSTEHDDRQIDGTRRVLFASDMHLGEHAPALTGAFLDALDAFADGLTDLFLLGDLFEAWIGDDAPDASAIEVARRLALLAGSGVRIRALRGNRDFLLGHQPEPATAPDYARRAGMRLRDEPLRIELFGRPVLLCHGDALCTDDVDYQRFRAQARSPAWQRDFLARSRTAREALARDYRQTSESSKQRKAQVLMDVNQRAVDAAMDAAGVDLMVHGHTHRPARHVWSHQGRTRERWVLPDWRLEPGRGGFLRVDAAGWARLGDWGG